MPNSELMDIQGAAARLKLSTRWVRLMCQLGRIGTRVGSRWIITKPELRRLQRLRGRVPRRPGRPRKTTKRAVTLQP